MLEHSERSSDFNPFTENLQRDESFVASVYTTEERIHFFRVGNVQKLKRERGFSQERRKGNKYYLLQALCQRR